MPLSPPCDISISRVLRILGQSLSIPEAALAGLWAVLLGRACGY